MGSGVGIGNWLNLGETIAGIPLGFMDYFNQRAAAGSVTQHQNDAINQASERGDYFNQQALDRAGAYRHEMLGGTNPDGSTSQGLIDRNAQEQMDRIKAHWDLYNQNNEWSRTYAQQQGQRDLIGPNGVLGQAAGLAQQNLQQIPTENATMAGDREAYRKQLAAIPTYDKLAENYTNIADISGQEAQNQKIYSDLMNARGQGEVAAAVGGAARQTADLDAQIRQLQAQGKTPQSDPTLANLVNQKRDLSMQVADATNKIAQQYTTKWAETSTALSANLTNLKNSLMSNLNAGLGAVGGAVANIQQAIGGSYETQAKFNAQLIDDAVRSGSAVNQVMQGMNEELFKSMQQDDSMRYDAMVTLPNQISSAVRDKTIEATNNYNAAMFSADSIASQWYLTSNNERYSFSPAVASALNTMGQLQDMTTSFTNSALATQQLALAQHQASTNEAQGWASVGVQAVNPWIPRGTYKAG